jgi:uncharacterized protein (TIGR02757 family)
MWEDSKKTVSTNNDWELWGAASPVEKKIILDRWVAQYNDRTFISLDPIGLPHRFSSQEDREIIGFWVAMLSWGNRKTIISKGNELLERMDHAPYDFVKNHQPTDLKSILGFKHRTFNEEDALYFVRALHRLYTEYGTMGQFFATLYTETGSIEVVLKRFHLYFFDDEIAPHRTRKHVSTPETGSACKRLNMFLRWMVRRDTNGVDFGLWTELPTSALFIPLDVHVARVAREMGLLSRTQNDWRAVEELTMSLRQFDADDPVKYDFALFSLGLKSLGRG